MQLKIFISPVTLRKGDFFTANWYFQHLYCFLSTTFIVPTAEFLIKIKSYSHFNLVPQWEFHVFSIETDFSLESTVKKIRGFTDCCDWITRRIVKEAAVKKIWATKQESLQPRLLDSSLHCIKKFVLSSIQVDESER